MEESVPSSPTAGVRSFTVRYEAEDGSWTNAWYRGQGLLRISPLEGEILLQGRKRSWWGSSRERVIRSGDILNVRCRGRTVQFWALEGRGRRQSRKVIFELETEEEARVVSHLLPSAVDDQFEQEEHFGEAFHQLPEASRPWTSPTIVIAALNIAVFLVMALVLDAGWFKSNLAPYMRFGASHGAATTGGEWWRLGTSLFLHFGLVHLGLNMWALFNIGLVLERLLGRGLFLLLYLGAGLGGGWSSLMWNGDRVWSAGASGAIFGLYGALMGAMLGVRGAVPKRVFSPVVSSTLWFVGYNVAFGLANRGIDNAAHVGGLVSGLLLGWLVMRPLDAEGRRRRTTRAWVLGVAAVVGMAVAGVAATPRFTYRVQEELAWSRVVDPFMAEERTRLEEQQARRERVSQAELSPVDYALWLQGGLAPFYTDWAERVEALAYTPGYRTERRRQVFAAYLRERGAALTEMARAIRENSPARLRAAEAAERAALEKLAAAKP